MAVNNNHEPTMKDVRWKRDLDGYISPTYYSYKKYYNLLNDPIVSRVAVSVEEAIRAHSWKIKVPTNEKAEEWINEVISDLYDDAIGKIIECTYIGFKIAEVYYEKDEDYKYLPKLNFLYPDGLRIKVDDFGRYEGVKQNLSGQTLDAEESIIWSYGVAAEDLYGRGNLQKIYPTMQFYTDILNNLVSQAKRHVYPITIVALESTGIGSESTYAKVMQQLSTLVENDSSILAMSLDPNQSKGLQLETIQPVAGGIDEVRRTYDDMIRRIIAGMLGTQKLFYSSQEDGGSYSLTQTQMAEFDRVIKGMWRTFKPGLEILIERTLWLNYRIDEFELDIEYVDEMSLASARESINELIKTYPSYAERVDFDAVASRADIPVRTEDDKFEIYPNDETKVDEEVSKSKDTFEVDKKEAKKLSHINQKLGSLANKIELRIVKDPIKEEVIKLALKLIEDTDNVYKQLYNTDELPKVDRDYTSYANGIYSIYESKLAEMEFYDAEIDNYPVEKERKKQVDALARNIGKMASIRWSDLVLAMED